MYHTLPQTAPKQGNIHVMYLYLSHLYLVLFSLSKSFNPLSPNIHIQILQTDLYTFP